MKFQPVIGLEIHIELNTRSKMFCSCPNDPDERHANVNICPICTAQPGCLPVINQEAVRKVIKTGLALNCQIPENSKFDRKNYFYPDLPKGYQISQYDKPLCMEGFLSVNGKKVRITRVHLEEDTGRLIHVSEIGGRVDSGDWEEITKGPTEKMLEKYEQEAYSLVDFNRAGIPLMELVTEPDINSAKEAREFAKELHLISHYLDISDADMEKGQMRIEVNISLISTNKNSRIFANEIRANSRKLGTKVEIKNLNSFRVVEKSIDYEIQRQAELLERGEKIIQETRGWDDKAGKTISQREKEEAHDYRYFPEPDLPPLRITEEIINGIKAEIPELPQQRKERLIREYGLDEKNVEVLVYKKDLGEYFEKIVSEFNPRLPKEELSRLIKLAANYLITDLQGILQGKSLKGEGFLINPENFAEFVNLIHEGKISSKLAKIILEEMFKTGADPSHIIEEKGLVQITSESEIEDIIKAVISENEKAVQDFKKGKGSSVQYLIGKTMEKTKGKASPKIVESILKKVLTD